MKNIIFSNMPFIEDSNAKAGTKWCNPLAEICIGEIYIYNIYIGSSRGSTHVLKYDLSLCMDTIYFIFGLNTTKEEGKVKLDMMPIAGG